MEEIWKDVVGYEGVYQVSNCSNVKSVSRCIKHYKGGISILNDRMLSQANCGGYKVVGLTTNNKLKSLKVHRLVALAFIPNPENKPEVNHKDGDKSNNNDWNLEWATGSENQKHAYKTGLHKGSHFGLFGEKNTKSKPVIQFDLDGNKISDFQGIAEAQRKTSVIAQNISFACNGKYKQAGGFIWKYKE